MSDGYIKIDRKILNWEWYRNVNTKVVFLHILIKANWKDGKFEGVPIPRGSLATSYATLAAEINLSEKEVRTALNHLKRTGELAVERHPKFSVITVKNYDAYQDMGRDMGTQGAEDGQRTGSQRATIEESKKEKREEIKKRVPKGTPKETPEQIINQYGFSERLKTKVNEWLTYKAERRETYKPTGLTALLRRISQKVDEYGENPVIMLIDECMANGWRGIIWDRLGKGAGSDDKQNWSEYLKDGLNV